MLIQNYSNLILEDVNLDGTALSGWAYALSNNCGTINLTGSTSITAKSGGRAFDTCKYGSYAIPTVNINTTGVISGPIEATGGKLNIENGKFDVTWVTDSHYAAGDIQIKGGIFSAKPEEEYCAEGYVATDNKDEVTKVQYPYTVMSKEDAGIFELFDSTTGDRYKPYSSYGITEDKNVQSVSYTRVFTTNDYNKYRPWYLPFDYTLTDDDLNNFDFYRISMIAGAAEAGEISTNQHQIILFIKKVESGGTLLANRPYILKAKENVVGEFVFKTENTTLYAPDATSRKHLETSEFKYDFFGNYEDLNTGAVGSMYYLGGQGEQHNL